MIFATAVRRRVATSTLPGLRSRWITPFWCACCTPAQTCSEQLDALLDVEPVLVAVRVIGSPRRTPSRSTAGPRSVAPASNTLRDVRVVHHRERLALELEAPSTSRRVASELDHLERDAARTGSLLGDVDRAHAARADLADEDPVGTDRATRVLPANVGTMTVPM
jgi:hypothetical protein